MTRREFVEGAAAMAATPVTGSSKDAVLRLRPAEERGMADHGWLRSAHSFSFAGYYDPNHEQFANLRVINDDRVAGGGGFPMHPHKDFEIFSYVLDGALEHKDSMGNGSVVKAGGVQYMSAGSGVQHSEFNPSATEEVHFLQIWLFPELFGAEPYYETLDIKPADKDGKLALFLSPEGRGGSIKTRADADIYAATLTGEQDIRFTLPKGRKGWVQLARGSMQLNDLELRQGDGVAIEKAGDLAFRKGDDAEFLLFSLPA